MNLQDILWFAENARRQQVGPLNVYYMAQGAEWYLEHWVLPPTIPDLLTLAQLVEPNHNTGKAFRNVNVRVGAYLAPDWAEVPRLMDNLIVADLPPDEWYREYELIHPLRDGNGRTGAVLWNGARWRANLGKFGVWEHPPDFYRRDWFK